MLYFTLLLATAVLAQDSNTPPGNDSATNPWWPQYPTGRSEADYMLNNSASEADLTGQSDIAKWLIEASNMWRAQFNSVPVTWNETSARIAQNHTNTCRWEHWGNDNLAQEFGTDETMRFDVRGMTEMWAVEWDYYPFSHPEQEAYSHFTAMTWNSSTTVGCGWNVNCRNDSQWLSRTYFVCNYWPPGNIMTTPPGMLFAKNVQNFTGWAVDETKASSISSLTAGAGPTDNAGSGDGGGGGGGGSGPVGSAITTSAVPTTARTGTGTNGANAILPAASLLFIAGLAAVSM